MRNGLFICSIFVLLVVFGGISARAACGGKISLRAVAEQVVDGKTVILVGGKIIKLAGLEAPGTAKAKQRLAELVAGRGVLLQYNRLDRHGRYPAQLFVEASDGGKPLWVQKALLDAGIARVSALGYNEDCMAAMLQSERHARSTKRGIWANPLYAILPAQDITALARKAGTFQIVRGRVLAAARHGKRVYINFGHDWKRDFTIIIQTKNWKKFVGQGLTIADMRGKEIQIRGWIDLWNGPMIEANKSWQIEIVE